MQTTARHGAKRAGVTQFPTQPKDYLQELNNIELDRRREHIDHFTKKFIKIRSSSKLINQTRPSILTCLLFAGNNLTKLTVETTKQWSNRKARTHSHKEHNNSTHYKAQVKSLIETSEMHDNNHSKLNCSKNVLTSKSQFSTYRKWLQTIRANSEESKTEQRMI